MQPLRLFVTSGVLFVARRSPPVVFFCCTSNPATGSRKCRCVRGAILGVGLGHVIVAMSFEYLEIGMDAFFRGRNGSYDEEYCLLKMRFVLLQYEMPDAA
jgi:hypothetical protein